MNSEKGFANISAERTYIEDFISRTRGLAEVSNGSGNGKKETSCCNISICFLSTITEILINRNSAND